MEKMEEWFVTLNQKVDRIGTDVIAVRGDLSEIREFIEQHQGDIHLCKLAIERLDEKIETLDERVERLDDKVETLKKPH